MLELYYAIFYYYNTCWALLLILMTTALLIETECLKDLCKDISQLPSHFFSPFLELMSLQAGIIG